MAQLESVPIFQFHPTTPSVSTQMKSFLSRNTREVKNFTAAPTPQLFSTSTIWNGLFTDQILTSNIDFKSTFQFNIFYQLMVFNGSLVRSLPLSLCVVFRPLDNFFFVIGPQ